MALSPSPRNAFRALVLLAVLATRVAAQDAGAAPPLVRVSLQDGRTFVGTIVEEQESEITLRTDAGIEVRIPRPRIVSISEGPGPLGGFFRRDPHDSRLLFAPTGRPLRKGEAYFSDHYVVFPGLTYGVTDSLSVAGGFSFVPAVSVSDQVYFGSARLAKQVSDNVALSAGALYAAGGGEAAAILFGVGTVGPPEHSLTLGLGFGGSRQEGPYPDYRRTFQWRNAPVLLVGGNLQLSNNAALVSENWLLLGPDFRLSEQPFALAVRLFGDRISADLGVVFVGEVIREGLPIPWLSVSYHFGRTGRPSASRRGR